MASEIIEENEISEFHWTVEDYKAIENVPNGVRRARTVIANHMRGMALDHVDELSEIVTIVGSIVQDVHQLVMTCSLYGATSAEDHSVMAVRADEIQMLLWNMHNDILNHRMRMLDLRRKYIRRQEASGTTLTSVETSFMFSMYLSSYERMIETTRMTIASASSWHHHMAQMHDTIMMAASVDAAAETTTDVDDSEEILPNIPELDIDSAHSGSSDGGDVDTVEQVAEQASKPKSPIDV